MSAFDPAAEFLLGYGYENLYDPTPSEYQFVCRGCGETVDRRDRAKHHRAHRRALETRKARTLASVRERNLRKARAARRTL